MICRTVLLARLQALTLTAPPPPGEVRDGWRPTSIGSVDSEVVPARCHWERAVDADRCADVLAAVERAWLAQVDAIGFAEPMPDEDGILDLYLTDDFTEGGAYTYGPGIDEDPTDGRMGCHAYVAIDFGYSDEELASTVIHEFNHVTQYATDFVEPTYVVWEAIASAAQLWTDPDGPTWPAIWGDFQATPWLGVLGDGYVLWDDYGLWSYYEYGAEIWARHLDGTWGDGQGGGGAALWWGLVQEELPNEPDVLDAWGDLAGGDWREALLAFSAERVLVGTARVPDWAAEGMDDPALAVPMEAEVDAADLPRSVVPAVGPYETGAVYVRVTGLPAGARVLARVDSATDVDWGLVAVEGDRWEAATTGELTWTGGGEADGVVFGAVNLGAPDFDGDDPIAPATMAIKLRLVEEDGDTGGTDTGLVDGDDTGEGATDTGKGAADTGAAPAGGGEDPSEPGCGCGAAGGGGSSLAVALGLLGVVLRRREELPAGRQSPDGGAVAG